MTGWGGGPLGSVVPGTCHAPTLPQRCAATLSLSLSLSLPLPLPLAQIHFTSHLPRSHTSSKTCCDTRSTVASPDKREDCSEISPSSIALSFVTSLRSSIALSLRAGSRPAASDPDQLIITTLLLHSPTLCISFLLLLHSPTLSSSLLLHIITTLSDPLQLKSRHGMIAVRGKGIIIRG